MTIKRNTKRKYYIPNIIYFLIGIILALSIILIIAFSEVTNSPINMAHIYISKPNATATINIRMNIVQDTPTYPIGNITYSIGNTQVKISNYEPWLGGINCSDFQNGQCMSHLANGEPWQNWVDRGAACTPEWSFGTKFRLPDGSIWTCVDRGSKINSNDGIPWVDLLTQYSNYTYGSIQTAEILQ